MKDNRSLAYAILRVTIGAIFLFYGISKLSAFLPAAGAAAAKSAKTSAFEKRVATQ